MASYKEAANQDAAIVESQKIKLSFEHVHLDDHFFLHGMTNTYFEKLFQALHDVSNLTVGDFKEKRTPLKPKKIDWNEGNTTRDGFPIKEGLTEAQRVQYMALMDDAFEFRVLTKGMGRVHGSFSGTIFHIVWFDPAHNLIPTDYSEREVRDLHTYNEHRLKAYSIEELVETCRNSVPRLEAQISEMNEIVRLYEEVYGPKPPSA